VSEEDATGLRNKRREDQGQVGKDAINILIDPDLTFSPGARKPLPVEFGTFAKETMEELEWNIEG